jgi:GntR family transcriptional regulator
MSRVAPEIPRGRVPPPVRLDVESDVPVFLQLYRQLVAAILTGAVPAGTRLPSARRFAADLGIHYHTVNKAYALLRHGGFAVLSRRKQLFARVPDSPGSAYLGDWSARQERLLHEALGSGLRPEVLLRQFRRLLRRAGTRSPAPARPAG